MRQQRRVHCLVIALHLLNSQQQQRLYYCTIMPNLVEQCAHGFTDRQTDRQADRQADRQTDKQAGRQADRQTYTTTHRYDTSIKRVTARPADRH
jgi:hypothetical protein